MSSQGCPFQSCFHTWLAQQKHDVDELMKAKNDDAQNEDNLRSVLRKNLERFEEYHNKRTALTKYDALTSFSSLWCTSFENSFHWIGGCRPSLSIQLVYTLCGLELESHLAEFLNGIRRNNLGELSANQLVLVDTLHRKTVKEEEEIDSLLVNLQENVGDEPLVEAERVGLSNGHVYPGFDKHVVTLTRTLENADKLRLDTLKELVEILTPLQAVDFLVAAKKLYLSMHEWGERWHHRQGRI